MSQPELEELKARLAEVTRRVYQLELKAGVIKPVAEAKTEAGGAQETPPRAAAPPPPSSPPPPDIAAALRKQVRSRDLETIIGGNWLNRIGIIALLTGTAYFLKLAFDNGWIGPAGRVAIGMVAGIAIVTWAARLHRRGNVYFSYSMTAVGIGAMYLSLWAAFQLYKLVPGGLAFAAMGAVTASAVLLALRQNAQIIAAIGLAGGFATPILLSTGQNRAVELFSYVLLLDVAALYLVAIRPWRRLLSGAFIGTTILYVGWFIAHFSIEQRALATAYATAFFVLFAVLPILKLLRPEFSQQVGWARSKTFTVVALLNPIVYFAELFSIFEAQAARDQIMAWSAVILAAFYIALARSSTRAAEAETDATGARLQQWLHLGIGIVFLTIAIPIALESHWITIAWIVESAVLLFVGQRLDHRFIAITGLVALGLGILRLVSIDRFDVQTLFLNYRFATYALAVAVLLGVAYFLRKEDAPVPSYVAVTLLLNGLALAALTLEAHDFFARRYAGYSDGTPYDEWRSLRIARDFTYSAVFMIYGGALLAYGFWKRIAALRWQALGLILITIIKVFLYDLGALRGGWRVLSFIALGVLLMGISFIYQKGWLKVRDAR